MYFNYTSGLGQMQAKFSPRAGHSVCRYRDLRNVRDSDSPDVSGETEQFHRALPGVFNIECGV
jgi:hypothetical protein